MNNALSLEGLADRLDRIEDEVATIRQELSDFRRQVRTAIRVTATQQAVTNLWADKTVHKRWIKDLFAELSIQGVPIGAQALQKKMGKADLMPNELSRAIIDAREE